MHTWDRLTGTTNIHLLRDWWSRHAWFTQAFRPYRLRGRKYEVMSLAAQAIPIPCYIQAPDLSQEWQQRLLSIVNDIAIAGFDGFDGLQQCCRHTNEERGRVTFACRPNTRGRRHHSRYSLLSWAMIPSNLWSCVDKLESFVPSSQSESAPTQQP